MARTANADTRLPAPAGHALTILQQQIVECALCPRLRAYTAAIGERRRRAYMDQEYWAKPVPGFGDPRARILIMGLAPGAHGANRTGRPFTGDGSGDFMYPVLYEMGLASSPQAVSRHDGLRLRKLWIGSVVRCAPPDDKPTPGEIRNCSRHLDAELAALPDVRVVVCLGRIAWDGYVSALLKLGLVARRSELAFGHGAEYRLSSGILLLGSYHPSLRNTNTGRLTRSMFQSVFVRAVSAASGRRRKATAVLPDFTRSAGPPSARVPQPRPAPERSAQTQDRPGNRA